jgi:hypothetical protein
LSINYELITMNAIGYSVELKAVYWR